MQKQKSQKHVHKYRKVYLKFCGHVFACSLPDCSHHMPSHLEPLLIGRASICWQCDTEMVLDEDSLKQEFPTCLSCRANVATGILDELSKI